MKSVHQADLWTLMFLAHRGLPVNGYFGVIGDRARQRIEGMGALQNAG